MTYYTLTPSGYVPADPQPVVVPDGEAVKTDPLVRDHADKVSRGNISAQAPAGQDPVVWTDADIARLDAAMNTHFPRKQG